jgi:antitoxin (DNA-binding transcriptional repressor) of toxin-antitoxin stability system
MQVNVHEAKTNLSKLLEKIESGEKAEITIARAGKPVAKLTACPAPSKPRTLGLLDGHPDYWEAPDCWEPDHELADLAVNSPVFPPEDETAPSSPPTSALAEDPPKYDADPPSSPL